MRYLILIITIVASLFLSSCEKDGKILFDAEIPKENITFTAMAGAAEMNYILPDNPEIAYIEVRYKDYKGKLIKIRGSYVAQKIYLPGFIDNTQNIPIEIYLIDRSNNYSEPIQMEFDVHESAPSLLLKNVEVIPYWSGFKVKYNIDDQAEGFLHINYIGMNRMTQELDTIFIETIPIVEGEQVLDYEGYANKETESTTVIISAETKRGDSAGKKVFENVDAIMTSKFPSSNIMLYSGSSAEDEQWNVGWKYLFDEDTKGYKYLEAKGDSEWSDYGYSFVSGKFAVPGDWVFDLGESVVLSGVKLYTALNYGTSRPWRHFMRNTMSMTPNKFKVYGSNDTEDPDSWVELGSFYENVNTPVENRWSWRSHRSAEKYENLSSIENVDPCYISVSFEISDNSYRYIKLYVEELYQYDAAGNDENYYDLFSIQEFEVYAKDN